MSERPDMDILVDYFTSYCSCEACGERRKAKDYIEELEMSHATLEADAAHMEKERDFYKRQYRIKQDAVEKLEAVIERKDRVFNDLVASRGVE